MARTPDVLLVASGDLRESANKVCWPAQLQMEQAITAAVARQGRKLVRAHPIDPARGHGFIASQREGIDVFNAIKPEAPLIVAEAVWQYSQHVLPGLIFHRGPLLTVANWSGQWPGLVGMLNLNGSLKKAGVPFSTLWSESFADDWFNRNLSTWLRTGRVNHRATHVAPIARIALPAKFANLGEKLADSLRTRKAILGVFDEGCMGMYNAIIPDELLAPLGVFKERLSQSALYAATMQIPDSEARAVYDWFIKNGMRFNFGPNAETDLTEDQVLTQCRMYIAALRIADEFGCDAIGIQYQQGLKDCLPASDLVEGALNDSVRPPVRSLRTGKIINDAKPLTHFNEVDECAGLDGLLTSHVHNALRQPLENTLHDLRWGDRDQSGTTDDYVWVFEISGAVPPSHFAKGWKDATGERQPPMYFRLGGSTIKGISKPGEIVWSRIFVQNNRLHMDIGRARAIELPLAETQRRWDSTTPQWPIMHAVLYGISRDQMMARHSANHIQVAYAHSAAQADACAYTKAAMAHSLGINVSFCGTRAPGKPWPAT